MFSICLPDDEDEAAEVLTDAFTDDPLFRFVFPDPDRHVGQVGRFSALTARRGITHGHGYKVTDGPEGPILGVAMWSPPGKPFYAVEDRDRINDIVVSADPGRAALIGEGFGELGLHRLETPHFQLQMIGVRTTARGRGIGAQLLGGSLDVVDRVGAVAHLESSNPRNLTIYRRHGFEVTAEVAMPDGGPVVRPMVRPAHPTHVG